MKASIFILIFIFIFISFLPLMFLIFSFYFVQILLQYAKKISNYQHRVEKQLKMVPTKERKEKNKIILNKCNKYNIKLDLVL